MTERTVFRACTLCEATCGLEIGVRDREITTIRGNPDDPLSRGYFCVKGRALSDLHEDPDRLRRPLIRHGGRLREASWEEAYRAAGRILADSRSRHGPGSVAVYVGNPPIHNLDIQIYFGALQSVLKTPQWYTAATCDAISKELVGQWMYGAGLNRFPVPDLDRSDFLLVLGANPVVSNGSTMACPDWPGKIRRIRARGGRVVVVDPRKTETATLAGEHHFIRPGTDALLLLAMLNVVFEEKLVAPAAASWSARGLDEVAAAVRPFSPEQAAAPTGIDAGVIRELTRSLAQTERAACYGRMGVSTSEHATVATWAIEALNVVCGNLDREGGMLFARPAATLGAALSRAARAKRPEIGRWRSRVRRLPEVLGQLPVATLADEILSPSDERVRILLTVAGNPVLTTPHAARLERALASLEAMVCVDFYLNETTRHASVVLPPVNDLARDHYDLLLHHGAARNVARLSPAVFPKPEGSQRDWEILARLVGAVLGAPDAAAEDIDRGVLQQLVAQELDPGGPFGDLSVEEVLEALGDEPGPLRVLDLLLRIGPYGDGFGRTPGGLTLDRVRAEPHGVDLGPLAPTLPESLTTPSGAVELAVPEVLAELARVVEGLDGERPRMLLIGRRRARSNNSWMHNLTSLAERKDRCLLLVNPEDAALLGVAEGAKVRVASRVGELEVAVRLSDEVRPGVVSLPHGWGHLGEGRRQHVADRQPGVNSNVLTDPEALDPISGAAVLNGIPVRISPAR